MLRHGHHEILRHFQGSKHFPRDQRLRLDTPVGEVLYFESNPVSPADLERQRDRIKRAPFIVRDREYHFSEDVIVDKSGAVDPNLAGMAKVSFLIKVLRQGGSYELVYQFWAQFTLSAGWVNVEVTWSPDHVLRTYQDVCIYFVACLVHFAQGDVAPDPVTWHQLGQTAWEQRHWIWRAGWGNVVHPAHMGETCVPDVVRGESEIVQWWSSAWSYRFGSHSRCPWPQRVCGSGYWWLKCPRRSIHQLFGYWVSAKNDRLPSLLSSSVETMPATDCL